MYQDNNGEFAIPLFSWAIGGAAVCPLTWSAVAAAGVGYVACWGVQKMIDCGSLKPGNAEYVIATGLVGSLVHYSFDEQIIDMKKKGGEDVILTNLVRRPTEEIN